ncbi:MAG: hypothetical protein ACRCYC_16655 [Paraclostridium sp.]|uniref:hypothetical protein n=1 Tax=Paraclostridium sp. TaxID=2023273 RepID=UPI003F3C995F
MNENELKAKLKLCGCIPADVLDELVERTCLVATWVIDWISNKGKSNVSNKQLELCMTQIEEYSSSLYELNDAISDLSKVKIGFDNQSFFEKIGKSSIYDSVSVSDDGCSLDSFEVFFTRVKNLKNQTIKRRDAALRTVGITFYSAGRMKDEVSYRSAQHFNNKPTFSVCNLLSAIESVAKKYKEKQSRDEVLQLLKFAWVSVLSCKHDNLCRITLSDSHPFFHYVAAVLDEEPINIRKSYTAMKVK